MHFQYQFVSQGLLPFSVRSNLYRNRFIYATWYEAGGPALSEWIWFFLRRRYPRHNRTRKIIRGFRSFDFEPFQHLVKIRNQWIDPCLSRLLYFEERRLKKAQWWGLLPFASRQPTCQRRKTSIMGTTISCRNIARYISIIDDNNFKQRGITPCLTPLFQDIYKCKPKMRLSPYSSYSISSWFSSTIATWH